MEFSVVFGIQILILDFILSCNAGFTENMNLFPTIPYHTIPYYTIPCHTNIYYGMIYTLRIDMPVNLLLHLYLKIWENQQFFHFNEIFDR